MTAPASFVPPDWLAREDELLAPYAMHTRESRGRRHAEPSHPYRTLFSRDRDRIIHSTAFRRLMHKTQVLVSQTNDHHRTRLTHTLEVTQIARTIARQLGLNEDLTEAIALSHDLGHPPFGHAGERTLDECMREHGGFEHNCHALRIVEVLEYRYAEFPGLNLSLEVLEAMAQHSKRPDRPEVAALIAVGKPLLEAQVADAADSLAYDAHDVDDALGIGLVTADDLAAVDFWRQTAEDVARRKLTGSVEQQRPTMIRAMIDARVSDLLEHTRRRLREENIRSVANVRACSKLLVGPSPAMESLQDGLQTFLRQRVYRHERVARMASKGARLLRELFQEFCRSPHLLPDRYRRRITSAGPETTVCDYLAGMTDRFARQEWQSLFQP